MAENLHGKIFELLAEKQLSISGINRELKAEGIDEHRLILTGYLRALRDLEILKEIDMPPSKIYSRPDNKPETRCINTSKPGEIYSLIRDHLMKVELDLRIPVGVYLVSKLFGRPCFRQELKLVGITPKHLQQYFEKHGAIGEVPDASLKGYRADITSIEIPPMDPGYEVRKVSEKISGPANEVLFGIIKEKINIEGLIPKTKQTKLI